MRRFVLAIACLTAAPAAVTAQVKNTQEGEAILGIATQNDVHKDTGVRLSPVGLNVGFIVQPMFGSRRVSIVEQIAFYPIAHYERQTSPFGVPFTARTNPLILNSLWMRWSTHEPEMSGRMVYFAGGGLSVAVSTPREGTKATGLVGIGARRWFGRQVGFEVSLLCGVQRVGSTYCQLPISSVWPFN